MRQVTLANQASFGKYGRKSKREQFLESMEGIVPWGELEALIEPHYPKAGNGRQPVGLSIMLRTYFLQQWFNPSDPGVEDAFYESLQPSGASRASIWAERRRRTRLRSCASVIFWKSMTYAARSWRR